MRWGGGLDFLRIILNGLCVTPSNDRSLFLLLPREGRARRIRSGLGAMRRVLLRLASGGNLGAPGWRPFTEQQLLCAFADYAGRLDIRFYDYSHRGLVTALRDVKADIVLPCSESLGRNFPVPWIGYIADFQHHYLPQLFTLRERFLRGRSFRTMLHDARTVLVNARTVRSDAEKYYAGSAANIIVLPFAPSVPPEWLDKDPSVVRRESGVPENYFIICNQFWVHKDHKTAFIAFASLLSRLHGDDVALVCTGGLHDYRAPGHIDRLKELLLELKITERVYLLGHIAKSEQIALVRGAVAVIQPTLFEGGPGGGSIYDAVALGVPSIVSDIPVNREVDASNLSYFSPGDDAELARLMLNAMENRKASASVAELLLQGEKRLAKLGQTLDYAISATLN